MTLLRDPQNPDKQSAARTFVGVTLLVSFALIVLDSLGAPTQPCAAIEMPTCAGPWDFTVSGQAWALLGSIVTMCSVWAGFGTSGRRGDG